jgi:hypothetical protein
MASIRELLRRTKDVVEEDLLEEKKLF